MAWMSQLPKRERPPNHQRLSKRRRERLKLAAFERGIQLCSKTTCINELPEDSKYKNCDPCREIARKRKSKQRAKWYDEGYCLDCGVLLDANIRCERCMEKQRKAYQRRRRQSPVYKADQLLESTQARASREGANYYLTKKWVNESLTPILDAGVCSGSGIPFDYTKLSGRLHNPWLPWVSRIDADASYNDNNVEVVVWALHNFKRRWEEKDVNYLLLKTLQAHGYLKAAPRPKDSDHCEITGVPFKDYDGPWAPVPFKIESGETIRVVNAYKLARSGLTAAEFDKLLYCLGKEWGYIK